MRGLGPCSGDAGSPGVGRTGGISLWLLFVPFPALDPTPGVQPGSSKERSSEQRTSGGYVIIPLQGHPVNEDRSALPALGQRQR